MPQRHRQSTPRGTAWGSPLTRRTLLRSGAGGAALSLTGTGRPTITSAAQEATPIAPRDAAEWPAYGRDPGGMRHSPLDQITRDNVQDLAVAWIYHTGELATYAGTPLAEKAAFEATPLMVGGTLYLSTPANRVIALDAGTGAERWVYDPRLDRARDYSEATSRGVATWVDPDKAPGDIGYRRLYLGTLDGRLICLDAATGRPSDDFGRGGVVDLTAGVGQVQAGQY
jgi:quinoprotein glucose dehydrogenase